MTLVYIQWGLFGLGLATLAVLAWYGLRSVPDAPEVPQIDERPTDSVTLAAMDRRDEQKFTKQMDIVWYGLTHLNGECGILPMFDLCTNHHNPRYESWPDMQWRRISKQFIRDFYEEFEFKPAQGGPVITVKRLDSEGVETEMNYILAPASQDTSHPRRLIPVADMFTVWHADFKQNAVSRFVKQVEKESAPLSNKKQEAARKPAAIFKPALQTNGAMS